MTEESTPGVLGSNAGLGVTVEAVRGFALMSAGGQTTLHVHELVDGTIVLTFSTVRNAGLPPLETGLRLAPPTFAMLSDALWRAAHDSTVWMPLD